jgi:hypothetical protein
MHPSTLAHANGFHLGQMGYAVSLFRSDEFRVVHGFYVACASLSTPIIK